MSYHGWPNYETWCAGLYLSDYDWYDIVGDMKVEDFAVYLKDLLEDEYEELHLSGMMADLLHAAINNIDFY